MPSRKSWPDTRESLLARLQDPSNEDAWQTFVDLYLSLIHHYCKMQGLQEADAKDVAQGVLTKVCVEIRSFEYDRQRGRFRSWLGVMTRHAILDFYRGGRQRQTSVNDQGDLINPPTGDIGSEWADLFNTQVLDRALRRIRPEFNDQTWESFQRVWIDRETPKNVAKEMHKESQWVYQQTYIVTRRLKAEICFLAEDIPFFQNDPGS